MNRIIWIDIAKGITIILMIMGHSSLPKVCSDFIYAFHMPLFFVSSGMTSEFNSLSFSSFIYKKVKGLLIPFLLYSVLVLLLDSYLKAIPIQQEILDWIKMGWLGTALWFVPVLFLSLIISWCFRQIKYKYIFIIQTFMLPLVSGYFCYNHVWFPWNVAVVPYASLLIILGGMCKKKLIDIIDNYNKWYIFILFSLITFFISYFWRMDMAWNKCMPVIPLTVGAFSGIILVFMLSKNIECKSGVFSLVFTRIGQETFLIMALSQITIRYINEYFVWPFYVKYFVFSILMVIFAIIKNNISNLFDKYIIQFINSKLR